MNKKAVSERFFRLFLLLTLSMLTALNLGYQRQVKAIIAARSISFGNLALDFGCLKLQTNYLANNIRREHNSYYVFFIRFFASNKSFWLDTRLIPPWLLPCLVSLIIHNKR